MLQGFASVSLFIVHVPFVGVANGSRSALRSLSPRARHAHPRPRMRSCTPTKLRQWPPLPLPHPVHRRRVQLQVSLLLWSGQSWPTGVGRGIRGTESISGVWRLVASGLFQVTEGVHNWKSGTLLAGRSSPRSCVKRVGRWCARLS